MSRERTPILGDDVQAWFNGDDRVWADAVMLRLLLKGVTEVRTREALLEAHDLVASSGEPAHDLFGEPREFVDEHLTQWREVGLPHREGDDDSLASIIAVQWALVALVLGITATVPALWRGQPVRWSMGLVAAPVLLSVLMASVVGVYRWGAVRHSRRAGVVSAVLTTVVGAGVCSAVFMNQPSGVPGSAWWGVPYVAGHLLGAALVLKIAVVRDARPRRATPIADDDSWAREVAAKLRTEAGLSDARVAQLVAEARAHASALGATLVEEFGSPASFTARQAPDVAATKRREAALQGAAALLGLILVVASVLDDGGVSWQTAAFVACAMLLAVGSWRASRREGRRAGR